MPAYIVAAGILLLLLAGIPAWGQDCEPAQITAPVPEWLGPYQDNEELACLANAVSERTQENLVDLLSPIQRSYYFSSYAARAEGYRAFLQAVEEARQDEQVGAPASSEGSTSLVSKGAVPQVLGFAVEHGALAQTASGTVATFRGNLLGVSRLLLGAQQFRYCPAADPACGRSTSEALRNLSFSFSFDASRESAQRNAMAMGAGGATGSTPVFTGSARQLSQWAVRYAVSRQRKRADEAYLSAWRESVNAANLGGRAEAWDESLRATYDDAIAANNERYSAWLQESVEALLNPQLQTPEQFYRAFAAQVDKGVALFREIHPDFDAQLEPLMDAMGRYFGTRDRLVDDALAATTFAVEYTNRRPFNQPSQSNVRFAFTKKPGALPATVSANFGLTFYNTLPSNPEAGRFRDLQAAIQVERPLTEIPQFGNATFTLAGYYQWMKEDALIEFGQGMAVPGTGIALPGATVQLLGTQGHIGIGQAKITIPLGANGVKVPIALTVANRTELIDATEVRGNIGLTFDLDALFLRRR